MKPKTFHQLLHGYKSGHGRIAGSIKLTERDADLVTRLSDLSGSLSSGVLVKPYLTVYPLPSQQFFAIARTWLDDEAPRSGCVLTHTLLIPLEEWGCLSDVSQIESLFRNLRQSPNYDFNKAINLEDTRKRNQGRGEHSEFRGAPLNEAAGASYVARYFGNGIRPIVWFDAKEPEEYLWRLLEHLWPQLRRKFSCCTFALQQRSLEDGPFELLFAPGSAHARFLKLEPSHFVEAGHFDEREASAEPWCQYWTDAIFSSKEGRPTSDEELPLWNDLGDDPTAVRKMFLIRELRTRASTSPTAGVGALDVVESLAYSPEVAIPLKKAVLSGAISAAALSQLSSDGLVSLRLIDDRLRRESFRSLAPEFNPKLSAATAKLTVKEPEAAIEARNEWLADSIAGTHSAFVAGVLEGLKEVAHREPSRLTMLRAHPDIAGEIFRLEPSFAATYLELGGESAPDVIAQWLDATREPKIQRVARRTMLRLQQTLSSGRLLRAILKGLEQDELYETLTTLETESGGFEDLNVRHVVEEQISTTFPEDVRLWGAHKSFWSQGITETVAATYPHGRQSFHDLLDDSPFNDWQRTNLVSYLITAQSSSGVPYWLRETISSDPRILSSLLSSVRQQSAAVDATLENILYNVPDLPFARVPDTLKSVFAFQTRSFFEKLFSEAFRALLADSLVTGASLDFGELTASIYAEKWYASVPASVLLRVVVDACKTGVDGVLRSWQWLANAPRNLFGRNAIIADLTEELLRYSRFPYPFGAELSMVSILRRARIEATHEARQTVCSKLLRFAFDNTSCPLSGVVAEAFAEVYEVALQDSPKSRSLFSLVFGSYDWDRGKDMRVAIIDTFMRSQWQPGDLAIAADRAGILRKIVKRLHRKYNGDNYIGSMISDLTQRSEPRYQNVLGKLQNLSVDPNIYEEWD